MPDELTPQLWVHRDVERRLVALPPRPWEVGGWLLGFWTGDAAAIFVTHATPPAGRGTPLGVRISGRGHRAHFDEAWERSGGHVTFLGDWHTHPGGVGTPSNRDQRATHQLATDPDFGTPLPLLGIVEAPRWPWNSRASCVRWHLGSDGGETAELEPHLKGELPEEAARIPEWRWLSRGQRNREAGR